MPEIIISDTSCLIVLSKIGQLDLLRQRYERVLIPREVQREFQDLLPEWITIVNPSAVSLDKVGNYDLDPGEKAAIALALDHPGALLIADDEHARKVAERFEIELTGTVGFLVKAKKAGLIRAVKPFIEQIMKTDFRLSRTIIRKVLQDAGEDPE